AAKNGLASLQALQRRFSTHKKEYDWLLQAHIAVTDNRIKAAATAIEKAEILLKGRPASDIGLQQLCKAYLQLSDVYAMDNNMLLASECTQRVLIAMSVGMEDSENLLDNPEFE